jgi:hypothetical protein
MKNLVSMAAKDIKDHHSKGWSNKNRNVDDILDIQCLMLQNKEHKNKTRALLSSKNEFVLSALLPMKQTLQEALNNQDQALSLDKKINQQFDTLKPQLEEIYKNLFIRREQIERTIEKTRKLDDAVDKFAEEIKSLNNNQGCVIN